MIKLVNLLEAVNVDGVKLSVVPINWKNPTEGKYSGQLKMQTGNQISYYKMTVDTILYDGNVLLSKLWKNADGSYGIATTKKGQVFEIDSDTMGDIVNKAKNQQKTFTVSQSGVDLRLDKKV